MHKRIILGCLFGVLCTVIVACAPAAAPRQLAFTPGPPVIVTDRTLEADRFITHIPPGWRTITGSALYPQSVTLVAPDNCALILISTDTTTQHPASPTCAEGTIRVISHTLALSPTPLVILGSAPARQWPEFETIFETVVAATRAITSAPGDS